MKGRKRDGAPLNHERKFVPLGHVLMTTALLALLAPCVALAQSIEDLQGLSLEDLGNIEISSVSKKAEPLSNAAAAVYVISHDDILRSGATGIPEMLRLAPNLQVARLNSTTYAITSRGFNGTLAN